MGTFLKRVAGKFILPQDIEKVKKLKMQIGKDLGTSASPLGKSIVKGRVNKVKPISVKVLK